MAFHLEHAKLINTTPPHMIERGLRILKAWQKEEEEKAKKKMRMLWLTDEKIAHYLDCLNPQVLASRRIRYPFRSTCTNSHLRYLFYQHAQGVSYYNMDAVNSVFPRAWIEFIEELWPGKALAAREPWPWEIKAAAAATASQEEKKKNAGQAPDAASSSSSQVEETEAEEDQSTEFEIRDSSLPALKKRRMH